MTRCWSIGDRVLVTGLFLDEQRARASVFRLECARPARAQGVFHISSNDYYTGDNYATRLVGDNLVIYTPMDAAPASATNAA